MMRPRNYFNVYLRSLNANEIEFRMLEDGRRWLDIADSVAIMVRPDDDRLEITIAGLTALAEAAGKMASSLAEIRDAAEIAGSTR